MKVFTVLFATIAFNSQSYFCVFLNNVTNVRKLEENPALWTEQGLWGPLLEEWALTGSHREKRVMKLIPVRDAYISNEKEIDDARESKINTGKIIATPQNNNNYNNNNNNPNRKQGRPISETDLYLLSAMEKLVFRMDFMEKRLRRVEEMLYYTMAGNRVDTEPCPDNFTRAGANCYLFSSAAGREYDWKVASKHCNRLGAVLAELESISENQDVIAHIQNNANLRGKDFWTGGLNPGLLWIWSNSARPVAAPGSENKKNPSAGIVGDGRCLRLAYDPALRAYSYKGTDCSIRYSYICEIPESSASNEITRLGRSRDILTKDN